MVKPLFPTGTKPPQQEQPPASKQVQAAPLFSNSTTPTRLDPSARIKAEALLPGMQVRHRLDPTSAELQVLSPNVTDPFILNRARNIVSTTNTDTPDTNLMFQFGLAVQKEIAESADTLVELAQMPILKSINDGLGNLEYLILTKKLGPHTSRREAIEKQGAELSKGIGICEGLRERADNLESLYASASTGLEAHMVAGRILLTVMRPGDPATVMMERRLNSLLTTSLSLLQMKEQLSQFRNLLSYQKITVTEALVNMVPAWCVQYSCNPSLGPTGPPKDLTERIVNVLRKARGAK